MKGSSKWLIVVAARMVAVVVLWGVAAASRVASAIACRPYVLCKNPYVAGITPYPCGQCTPCRLNRRRLWTHRIMLESQLHEYSSFWTLTYSDECVPLDRSVSPRDTQLFLKRLRSMCPDRKIRYYLVGEYGDETQRPHYHVALFGVHQLEDEWVRTAWGLGHVDGQPITLQLAQYVAGYVVKKMTKDDDPRLAGRHPEFARMSLRPGIGAGAVPAVAELFNDSVGARAIGVSGDVPTSLRHGGRSLPLGRYLRRKLREEMGFETHGGQQKALDQQHAELQAMLEITGSRSAYLREKPFIETVKIRQIEGKAKIFSKKGKL